MQEQRQKPSVVKKNRLSACFLSSSELTLPLVCDYVGNLYSKASIVEFLLWKKNKLDDSEESQHKYVHCEQFALCKPPALNLLTGSRDSFSDGCPSPN